MTYSFVTSNTCVVENERIAMTLDEGPFEVLDGSWFFKALSDEGCRIDLSLGVCRPRCTLSRLAQSQWQMVLSPTAWS